MPRPSAPLVPSALLLLLVTGCNLPPAKDSSASTGEQATAAPAAAPATGEAPTAAAGAPTEGDKPETADAAKTKDESAGKDDSEKKKAEDKKKEEETKREEAKKKWEKSLEDLEKSTGLFTLHHDDSKLLLELDEKAFGREFLYYGALNSGAGGGIYRGAMLYDSPYLLHFERRNEKNVVLRAKNLAYLDGEDAREQRMLGESVTDGIVKAFEIVAELEDEKRVLIDLGAWFLGDNLELAKRLSGKYAVAKELSLIDGVKSFPRNIEIGVEMVYTSSSTSSSNMTLADPRGTLVLVQHSLVAPPEDGFKPRTFDQRVGYFYTERKSLFDRQTDDPVARYANRWRLVKKDPTADVSDPVQPIVYWIENSTPPAFRQAVKEGIEAWEPAFRKAGFSNAIVAKQMPEDADWDPADVRYAVVRWSEDENVSFAIGPSRVDPRTGEIFDADITMQAGFINVYAERFQTYVSGRLSLSKDDILAELEANFDKTLPADEELRLTCQIMGEERSLQAATAALLLPMVAPEKDELEFLQDMIREVTAHEVGHTLGLRHNFKSSTWQELASIYDPENTSAKGIYGSFMEYAPPVIAPPGTEQGQFFQSVIGPYDYWAIDYGYREFGSNEDKSLAAIAARSHESGHEYGTDEDSFLGDPFSNVWDMGKDPIEFARQQIQLAEWGLGQLTERAAEQGDGYHMFARYYGMFQYMYNRAHEGLYEFIGGYAYNRDLVGQEGGRPPIEVVDAELQRKALDVMIEKGLRWKGGIPDEQRLLLANKKYGSFGSWFDPWSFDPLPRIVNASRFSTLAPLLSVWLNERLASQSRFVAGGGLDIREVGDRVFDAVWPAEGDGRPDEHDQWTQSDYVSLTISALGEDTTPTITALFYELLARCKSRLAEYAGSSDRALAAHGRWLGDRIRRFEERQQMEF